MILRCDNRDIEKGSDISCKLSPDERADNLHELLKLIFSEKLETKYFKLLSAESFTQHSKY